MTHAEDIARLMINARERESATMISRDLQLARERERDVKGWERNERCINKCFFIQVKKI